MAFRVIPGALLKAIFPMERVWVWLYSLWHRREASEWDSIPRDCSWAFHGEEQGNIRVRQHGHLPVHPSLMAVTEQNGGGGRGSSGAYPTPPLVPPGLGSARHCPSAWPDGLLHGVFL